MLVFGSNHEIRFDMIAASQQAYKGSGARLTSAARAFLHNAILRPRLLKLGSFSASLKLNCLLFAATGFSATRVAEGATCNSW